MNLAVPPPLVSRVDHLVVAADTLAQGVAWCEATLGVVPGPGGRHPLMGTQNRLLAIGSPDWPEAYLEIIAIDPDAASAPADGRARWFDLDAPLLQAALRVSPRLVHWVAATGDMAAACAALAALGEDVGVPVAASRSTPEGELRWQITLRADGRPQHGGGLPALIHWQGRHPSAAMKDAGVQLRCLAVNTAHAPALRAAHSAIGLRGVGCVAVGTPAFILDAELSTPRGLVQLRGGTVSAGTH